MKANPNPEPAPAPRPRPFALVGVAFLLGLLIAGIFFHNRHAGTKAGQLSDSTKTVLSQLSAPVTIRYYALLPAGSADEALSAYAGRVARLLDALQTASGGKLTLARFETVAETNAVAAGTDGLQPFNLDKGDACFLGLTIVSEKTTETMARLNPEWEPALEFDLARAIQRVAAAAAPPPPPPEVAKPSPEIIATINRLIPDVNAVSMEDASRIFHNEFLKQCHEVGTETEAEFNAAQQKVVAAQENGDAAVLEAARKNLGEVQLAQGQKLKDLAAQLETRLAVFERMKSGATNDAK